MASPSALACNGERKCRRLGSMRCILTESLLPQQALREETEQAALWPAPGTEAAAGMDSEARTFIPSRVASPPPKHRREWQLLCYIRGGGCKCTRSHVSVAVPPRSPYLPYLCMVCGNVAAPPRSPHHRLKGRLRSPRSTQVLSTRSLGLLNFASEVDWSLPAHSVISAEAEVRSQPW